MKLKASTFHIALLCGSLLLSVSSTSAQKPKPPDLQGTYSLIDPTAATDTVKKAINAAVKDVSILFRGSVRDRLEKTNLPPPRLIVISYSAAGVAIKTDQSGTIETPTNGKPVVWIREDKEKFQVSTKWVKGNLERTFKGGGGQRVNTYSLNGDGTTLTLRVTLTSSWLKRPCAYELVYQAAASTSVLPASPQVAYYYYKDKKGEWRWRLKAANGRILAGSGEGYKNEQDCLRNIDLIKQSANAPVKKQ